MILNEKLVSSGTIPGAFSQGKTPESFVPGSMALSDGERKQIYTYSRPLKLRKRQMLYSQGDCDDKLYILMEGAVKLTKYMHNGREYIMDIMGEKSVFGQIPDLETVGNDTAVVMEDGFVNVLDRRGYERLSKKSPKLSVRLKKIIYLRRQRRERKLLDLLNCTVEQRLANALISLLEDFGEPQKGGFLLKAGLTHRDFADMIASTRETVTMKLNKFIKEHRIEYEGKYILVKSFRKISGLVK